MSVKIKPNLNLKVLVARALSEMLSGKANIAKVFHDDRCLGFTRQSMKYCDCRPEIEISRLDDVD